MVSWKTKLMESGFYCYGIGLLTIIVCGAGYATLMGWTDIVTPDVFIITFAIFVIGVMIAGLASDIMFVKRKLKKKGK